METFQIKNHLDQSIIWEGQANSLGRALRIAIDSKIDLSYANLRYANLINANLRNANLSYVNLSYADLYNADLTNANLCNANLRNANLRDANLSYANLTNANLTNVDLSNADLSNADLSNADLYKADLYKADLTNVDLSYANLRNIKEDFLKIISVVPHEVIGLKNALIDGKVDGSVYEGECACLIGTIAKLKHCNYKQIPNLKPNSFRPAEIFFFAIKKGDTLETNQVSKIVVEWIDEFLKNSQ